MKNLKSEIVNQAIHQDKPTAICAFESVQRLTESIADITPEIAESLTRLHGFCLPSIPRVYKNPEKWLTRAVAKDDKWGLQLHYIHSLDGFVFATDGHRAHMWKTNKYLPGTYDVTMRSIKPKHNVKRCISTLLRSVDMDAPQEKLDLTKLPIHIGPILSETDLRHIHSYVFSEKTKTGIDVRYLKTAANRHNIIKVLVTPDCNKMQPLVITGPFPDTYALIMPKRLGI